MQIDCQTLTCWQRVSVCIECIDWCLLEVFDKRCVPLGWDQKPRCETEAPFHKRGLCLQPFLFSFIDITITILQKKSKQHALNDNKQSRECVRLCRVLLAGLSPCFRSDLDFYYMFFTLKYPSGFLERFKDRQDGSIIQNQTCWNCFSFELKLASLSHWETYLEVGASLNSAFTPEVSKNLHLRLLPKWTRKEGNAVIQLRFGARADPLTEGLVEWRGAGFQHFTPWRQRTDRRLRWNTSPWGMWTSEMPHAC